MRPSSSTSPASSRCSSSLSRTPTHPSLPTPARPPRPRASGRTSSTGSTPTPTIRGVSRRGGTKSANGRSPSRLCLVNDSPGAGGRMLDRCAHRAAGRPVRRGAGGRCRRAPARHRSAASRRAELGALRADAAPGRMAGGDIRPHRRLGGRVLLERGGPQSRHRVGRAEPGRPTECSCSATGDTPSRTTRRPATRFTRRFVSESSLVRLVHHEEEDFLLDVLVREGSPSVARETGLL